MKKISNKIKKWWSGEIFEFKHGRFKDKQGNDIYVCLTIDGLAFGYVKYKDIKIADENHGDPCFISRITPNAIKMLENKGLIFEDNGNFVQTKKEFLKELKENGVQLNYGLNDKKPVTISYMNEKAKNECKDIKLKKIVENVSKQEWDSI